MSMDPIGQILDERVWLVLLTAAALLMPATGALAAEKGKRYGLEGRLLEYDESRNVVTVKVLKTKVSGRAGTGRVAGKPAPKSIKRGSKIEFAVVPEGSVLKALQQWREKHCQELQKYQKGTRKAQLAAERYWDEYEINVELGEAPPRNPAPGIKIKDVHGNIWVIDDRYIMMMDRMIGQLQRWLAYEE